MMRVEAAKAVVAHLTLPPTVEQELRRRAPYPLGTLLPQIEGNRLTLAEPNMY